MYGKKLLDIQQLFLIQILLIFLRFKPLITWQIWKWKWSSQLWSNLSSCKQSQEKHLRLQQDLNPRPPRYRYNALPTELWSLIGSRSRASSIYTLYMKSEIMFVWYNHIHALQIKNRSEKWSSQLRRSLALVFSIRSADILYIYIY